MSGVKEGAGHGQVKSGVEMSTAGDLTAGHLPDIDTNTITVTTGKIRVLVSCPFSSNFLNG